MKYVAFGWNSGEFGRRFWGRTDIERYELGAAFIENFQITFSGSAITGPRTRLVEFLRPTSLPVASFAFEFSSDLENAYFIIFTEHGIYFARDGALILDASKVVSGVASGVVSSTAHGYSDGDLVYLAGLNQITVVSSAAANTWLARDIDGNVITFNSGATTSSRVFRLAHPYAAADLPKLKAYQVFDQVKFTHPGYTRYLLTRTTNSWTFAPEVLAGGTPLNFSVTGTDTGAFIKSVRVTNAGSGYTTASALTVSDASGSGARLFPTVQSGGIVGVTIVDGGRRYTAPTISGSGGTGATFDVALETPRAEYVVAVSAIVDGQETGICRPTVLTGRANFTTAAGSAVYTWPTVAGAESYNVYRSRVFPEVGQANAGAELFFIGNVRGTSFTDSNIQADTTKGPRFFQDPFAEGAISFITVTAPGSGYTHASVVTVTDANGSGFVGYPIVSGGALIGIYIANPGSGYTNPSVSVSAGTGATFSVTLAPSTGLEPAVSFFFQQRAGYAGSDSSVATLRASKVREFDNFSIPKVLTDEDPYEYTIDSNKLTRILFAIPVQQGLLVGTNDGVFLLRAAEGQAVTPLNAILDRQTFVGATDVPPITIGDDIVYVENKSRGLRMLILNANARRFDSQEITFFSRHLFEGREVVSLCSTYSTNNQIYAVMSDGGGIHGTIQREQQTFAFSRLTTKGKFLTWAALDVGTEEHIYALVRRGSRVSVEYIKPNDTEEPEDQITLDGCISTVKITPAASLTLSGASGVVTATASAGVFTSGDVGKLLRAAGGYGLVTAYISVTQVQVEMIRPANLFDFENTSLPKVELAGDWWINPLLTAVNGIPYEGQTVHIVGDGKVLQPQIVTGGSVALSEPSAIVHVGFPVRPKLVTLGPPTSEGQNINIVAVAIYYSKAQALRVGKINRTNEVEFRGNEAYSAANDLRREGEKMVYINGGWDADGRITVEVEPGTSAEILRIAYFYEEGTDVIPGSEARR